MSRVPWQLGEQPGPPDELLIRMVLPANNVFTARDRVLPDSPAALDVAVVAAVDRKQPADNRDLARSDPNPDQSTHVGIGPGGWMVSPTRAGATRQRMHTLSGTERGTIAACPAVPAGRGMGNQTRRLDG
jgi:hypothetical protein